MKTSSTMAWTHQQMSANDLDAGNGSRAEQSGNEGGNRHEGGSSVPAQRDLGTMQAEVGEHQERDEGENQKGFEASRFHVGRFQIGRRKEQPPAERQEHASQGQQGHQVEGEQEPVVQRTGKKRQACAREDAADEKFTVGEQQQHERPEDDEMIEPERLLHHPQLAEGIDEHVA